MKLNKILWWLVLLSIVFNLLMYIIFREDMFFESFVISGIILLINDLLDRRLN